MPNFGGWDGVSSGSFIGALFYRYQRDLQRFLARRFGNASEAEDIVQEAFHNLLRVENIESLENPKAYLYRAANNLALNRIRHHRYQTAYVQAQEEGEAVSVCLDRQVSAERDLYAVERTLALLPEKYRRTFEMSRVEGKTYSEIAATQGIAVSTVEKHIIRALKFLRENLPEETLSECE